MRGTIRIATIAGIDILLHWTFSLLLVGLVAFYSVQGATLAATGLGLSLVLALFACVILHELGHALMARSFSVPTRDITLYPIGGVARLQRIPEEPMKEFWIAIAGPAVNAVIAAGLFVVIIAGGLTIRPGNILDPRIGFFATLMWLNVALVVFNLLPAFPMDGGRVLRALLAVRLEYTRATEIAAGVGQGMAILFGLLGLISFNPILIFIALFVYLGAQQESRHAMLRAATQGIPVRRAMLTRYSTLDPDDTLATAVEKLLRGADQDFPVVRNGQVLGLLTRRRLMQGLTEQGQEARVGSVVEDTCITVEDGAMLEEAFQLMQEGSCSAVPVVRNGELVGVLTLENIGELMMVSSALRQRGSASGAEVSRIIPS